MSTDMIRRLCNLEVSHAKSEREKKAIIAKWQEKLYEEDEHWYAKQRKLDR